MSDHDGNARKPRTMSPSFRTAVLFSCPGSASARNVNFKTWRLDRKPYHSKLFTGLGDLDYVGLLEDPALMYRMQNITKQTRI